jgi:phosphate transport system substrate-binding protein
MITNTDSKTGYPISYFTWILVYNNQALSHSSYSDAESFISFLKWLVTDAQSFSDSFNFSPLSKSLRSKALTIIDSLTYSGQSI